MATVAGSVWRRMVINEQVITTCTLQYIPIIILSASVSILGSVLEVASMVTE